MDADEVQSWKWVNIAQVYHDISHKPELYTSWLKAELQMLQALLKEQADG